MASLAAATRQRCSSLPEQAISRGLSLALYPPSTTATPRQSAWLQGLPALPTKAVDNLVNNNWMTPPRAHEMRPPDRSGIFCSTKKAFTNQTLKNIQIERTNPLDSTAGGDFGCA
jgi:hypothetical protein